MIFKSILIFIILLFFSFKEIKKASLSISISNCRFPEESAFSFLKELKILKDGKLIKKFNSVHYRVPTLDDLDTGNYILQFKSIFRKTENQLVRIIENRNYSVTLCTDYIDHSKEKYIPFIDRLQNQEYYEIFISSRGCYHSYEGIIHIIKKDDSFQLEWDENTKILTQDDIRLIRNFEIELNYMRGGYCTTSSSYTIKYKNKTKKISDGNCDWFGSSFLKKQLFAKK